MVDINDFQEEKECIYKGERYSVRDNGAIMRHSKEGKKARPLDNNWTFGSTNHQNGYMYISSAIVAKTFHGELPTLQHIVDHKDTNRQNNRPENLRWLTKLENALNNTITRNRIIYKCGSIEAFLKNPSLLGDEDGNYTDISWMRTVTPEEAKNSWERLNNLTKSDGKKSKGGKLGEWIYSPIENDFIERKNYIMSLTPNAAQRIVFLEDKPYEYPCTPPSFVGNPLKAYKNNLTKNAIFFRNHNGSYLVVESKFSKDLLSVYVLTKAAYSYKEQENGEYLPMPIAVDSDEYINSDSVHISKVSYEDELFIHDRETTGSLPKEYVIDLYEKLE